MARVLLLGKTTFPTHMAEPIITDELWALINAVPAIKGKPGAPRYRFDQFTRRPGE